MSQRPYNKRLPPHFHKGHLSNSPNGYRKMPKKISRHIRDWVKKKQKGED